MQGIAEQMDFPYTDIIQTAFDRIDIGKVGFGMAGQVALGKPVQLTQPPYDETNGKVDRFVPAIGQKSLKISVLDP